LRGTNLPTYRMVAIAGSRLPMQVLFQKDRGANLFDDQTSDIDLGQSGRRRRDQGAKPG